MTIEDDEPTRIQKLSDLQAERDKDPGKQTPYLIVLAGHSVGKLFRLKPGELIIGRSSDAVVSLDDAGVSRRHARLICTEEGGVTISDLGSTNGTWVEGNKIRFHTLEDGERIQIGGANILKYGVGDSLEEQFVSQLYESATKDGLTGAYNKRFFLERLRDEVSWHQRHKQPLTLIMLDIDLFKTVNDTYGHPVGDFILKNLSLFCMRHCRTEDIFARYGGEEFALILRQTSSASAVVMAERIRETVQSLAFEYPGQSGVQKIKVTISGGVAELDESMKEPAALVEKADAYLYEAKRTGRNRVCHSGR